MMDMIREGGFWALVVVVLGVLGNLLVLILTGAALALRKRGVAYVAMALCAFTIVGLLAIGGLGYFAAMRKVEAAVVHAPLEMQQALHAQGKEEAGIALLFAAAFSVLPFVCSIGAAGAAAVSATKDA